MPSKVRVNSHCGKGSTNAFEGGQGLEAIEGWEATTLGELTI